MSPVTKGSHSIANAYSEIDPTFDRYARFPTAFSACKKLSFFALRSRQAGTLTGFGEARVKKLLERVRRLLKRRPHPAPPSPLKRFALVKAPRLTTGALVVTARKPARKTRLTSKSVPRFVASASEHASYFGDRRRSDLHMKISFSSEELLLLCRKLETAIHIRRKPD